MTRTYTPNVANEYTQIAANGVPQIPTGVDMYDVRGNLARDDGIDADPDDGFVYEYDPENRLTKVEYDDGTNPVVTMAEYRYDAIGRRIEYKRYSDAGALIETIRYYYDGQNVVAEYTDNGTAEVLARQFYNGSQYIDERIAMRDYQTGPTARDHYYLHQELYSEAGLAAANGALEEAYVYDTYGEAKIYQWPVGDFDRDGDVETATDFAYLLVNNSGSGSATDKPWLDLDGDGDVDDADEAILDADTDGLVDTPVSAPAELAYSAVRNPYLFTGRTTDTWHANGPTDTAHYQRKQWNRNRYYDAELGAWDERDPLGYHDGSNLYEYVGSSPLVFVDPMGTAKEPRFFFCKYEWFKRLFYSHNVPGCKGGPPSLGLCAENIRRSAYISKNLAGRFLYGELCYGGFDDVGHGFDKEASGQLYQLTVMLGKCGQHIKKTCCPGGGKKAPVPVVAPPPPANVPVPVTVPPTPSWKELAWNASKRAAKWTADKAVSTGEWVLEHPVETGAIVTGTAIIVIDVITIPSGEGAIGVGMIKTAISGQ